MRIAVITSSYPRYMGDPTAPFIKSICEQMVKLSHEISVVAPYDPACEPQYGQIVPVHRFRYIWPARFHVMGHAHSLEGDLRLRFSAYILLPFFLISSFITLLRLTGKQKSQVIHAHWVLPSGFVAALVARIRNIPLIISLHGSDIFIAMSNPIFRFFTRWIFNKTNWVTACSPELAQKAVKLNASKVRVIPYGVDPHKFHPSEDSSNSFARHHSEDSMIRIISLGRMVYKKGFNILIEAMPKILQSIPTAHLFLGGDGDITDELKIQVSTLDISNHVTFVGKIVWNDVPRFLSNGDIFVLPSIIDQKGNVDGLPNVLLEAMSTGIAVVASNIGGVSLVVKNNKNGILFPPGDVEALSRAVIDLASNKDKRKSLGTEGRNEINNKFNWRTIAEEYLYVIASAIWQYRHLPRLGTIYRHEMLSLLNKKAKQGRVLDVGCYDGFFLSSLEAPIKIGVDPYPVKGAPGVQFVRAEGSKLPFPDGVFDYVYALDSIEHVENDKTFALSLCRMIAPNGKLVLTTPSAKIKMFPPFLTGWISHRWGHLTRRGYYTYELILLFRNNIDVSISTWNAPAFRTVYLLMKLFSRISPRVAINLTRQVAKLDKNLTNGDHGFLLLEGTRKTNRSD